MNEEKKREPHPIALKALEIARVGFELVEFDDYAVEQLEEALKECFGKQELFNAVVDLVNLAGILKEEGSPSAALKLIKVACIATDELEKIRKE